MKNKALKQPCSRPRGRNNIYLYGVIKAGSLPGETPAGETPPRNTSPRKHLRGVPQVRPHLGGGGIGEVGELAVVGEGVEEAGGLKPERFESLGISGIGRSLSLTSYQNLTAVTDRAPLVDYKSLPKDRVAQDLVAHQRVLEEILKRTTVIPAKFGTFLEDETEVKALLGNFYHKLEEVLEKFAGKVELDVVALWDNEKIFKSLYRENPQLRQLQVKVASAKDSKSGFDLKVQLGKKVAEALEKRKEKYLPLIIAGLQKCSEDICHHELMNEMMILNSSFLLPKGEEKKFEEVVNRLDKSLNSELRLRIVGPLPPYSFATLEIRKIGTQELKKAGELLGLSAKGGFASGGEEVRQKSGLSTAKAVGDVSLKEIKTSFRRMATQSHPDHQPAESAGRSEAEKRFGRINEAYQLLSDYHESGGESNLIVKILRLDSNPTG